MAFIFRMSGRLFSNAFAFEVKRQSVLVETHLRLKENALAFGNERKDVFFWFISVNISYGKFLRVFPFEILEI